MRVASLYMLEFVKMRKKKAVDATCEDEGILNVLMTFFHCNVLVYVYKKSVVCRCYHTLLVKLHG